jgi:hypothetical protein
MLTDFSPNERLKSRLTRRVEVPPWRCWCSDRMAAVVAGGRHVAAPHEASIASDPFRDGVRVLITGPHGFQRTVSFALDEVSAAITQRVRETLEE